MMGMYCYGLDHEEMTWTQEKDWLFLLIDRAGLLTVGPRTQPFKPFSTFVIQPGSRCRISSPGSHDTSVFWIRFIPKLDGVPMVAVPHHAQLGEHGRYWEKTLRAAMNRSYQMGVELRAHFTSLLWTISLDPGSIRQQPALEIAERTIENSIGETVRVEDLAKLANVSHNHLIRLFRKEHGVTPLEFIRLRKQHHACKLLLESNLTVKQVAARVGITDLSQFARLVKLACGMSPRELRESNRAPNLFRT
jgi:AraC-like DNA-binding protein